MERNADARPSHRRTSRSSADIASALLDAAAVEFAAHGFEGASTRRIAERAGAHQPQINYHFQSKEQLWQAAVGRLFDLMASDVLGDGEADSGALGDGDATEVLADRLRRFIHFSAEHPELNRIINLEATTRTPRLDWLVATHLRPLYALVDAAWTSVRSSGRGAALSSAEVWEITTSYGALHFANEPMLAALGTSTGPGRAGADAHADRLLMILLGEGGPGRAPSAV